MRKFIFSVLFIVVGLSYIFNIDRLILQKFDFFNDLKLSYIEEYMKVSKFVNQHLEQASTIEKLDKENEELKKYKILYTATQKKLDTVRDLLEEINQKELNPNIELVKVLSYTNYDDFTKVWINKKVPKGKILGLISGHYAAGIVVNQDNRTVALLNGNKNCSYAVFIGENKVPGIITSEKNSKHMIIKYIPIWNTVKIGDEVVTSGMDTVFFEGLKVGKVIDVTHLPDMNVAKVELYANVLKKKYFYAYEYKGERAKILDKTED